MDWFRVCLSVFDFDWILLMLLELSSMLLEIISKQCIEITGNKCCMCVYVCGYGDVDVGVYVYVGIIHELCCVQYDNTYLYGATYPDSTFPDSCPKPPPNRAPLITYCQLLFTKGEVRAFTEGENSPKVIIHLR